MAALRLERSTAYLTRRIPVGRDQRGRQALTLVGEEGSAGSEGSKRIIDVVARVEQTAPNTQLNSSFHPEVMSSFSNIQAATSDELHPSSGKMVDNVLTYMCEVRAPRRQRSHSCNCECCSDWSDCDGSHPGGSGDSDGENVSHETCSTDGDCTSGRCGRCTWCFRAAICTHYYSTRCYLDGHDGHCTRCCIVLPRRRCHYGGKGIGRCLVSRGVFILLASPKK